MLKKGVKTGKSRFGNVLKWQKTGKTRFGHFAVFIVNKVQKQPLLNGKEDFKERDSPKRDLVKHQKMEK